MKNIAIKRLHILPLPEGSGISVKHRQVFVSELAVLGYRVSNPECLDSAAPTLFLGYADVMKTLAAMRGGDIAYVPLFTGFPSKVPDDNAYFCSRLLAYLDGHFADFDLRDFGADPISQFQTRSLFHWGKARQAKRKVDTHTEWTELELVSEEQALLRLRGWLTSTLYAGSSVKESLSDDIAMLLRFFGTDCLDLSRITMKESRSLVAKLSWEDGDLESACELLSTPTDVLRMFAAITNCDRSLASPITFPQLKRRQRRAVLGVLEGSNSLADDLMAYKGLWLALGRGLHPGEYRRAYPKTAAAFQELRNGTLKTFNSQTESLLRARLPGPTLRHLSKRPGVLGRKLHELLRVFPQQTISILRSWEAAAQNMTIKNLLVLRSYFSTINELEHRTVVNKRGKIKVLDNNAYGALSTDQAEEVCCVIERALLQKLAERDSWHGKSVWIDPGLAKYTVPLQQRAASDGLLHLGRGTRIPVDLSRVLRLFVYWKEEGVRTDLDLSVIQLGRCFDYKGHVSYTNLSSQGIVHSGDLQSAPHGAAEFIDISLRALAKSVRYLAVEVHRFAGSAFGDIDCHAGWMAREKVDASYQSFDIKTVVNKFDLSGRTGYCVPLVVDLENQEIIMTDLYVGSRAMNNNVENSHRTVSLLTGELARFTTTRPTLHQLASLHAKARGAVLTSESRADIRFGINGCTYNANEPEALLAELL